MLRPIAREPSNQETGTELVLSEHTARDHVGHVLSTLDLRDRVQAVVLTYTTGLVQPGEAESARSAMGD